MSSINNSLIHAAAIHLFEDTDVRNEPNVPPPQPLGLIYDGISIKISEGGWGNEWYNMNGETNGCSQKCS